MKGSAATPIEDSRSAVSLDARSWTNEAPSSTGIGQPSGSVVPMRPPVRSLASTTITMAATWSSSTQAAAAPAAPAPTTTTVASSST